MSGSDSKEHIVTTSSAVVSTDIAIIIAMVIAVTFPLVILCFCYCKHAWIWRKAASLDDNSNQLRSRPDDYPSDSERGGITIRIEDVDSEEFLSVNMSRSSKSFSSAVSAR